MGELLGGVFDEVAEDGFVVVADQGHFADIGDFRKRLQTVLDNGVTGDFKEGLYGNITSVSRHILMVDKLGRSRRKTMGDRAGHQGGNGPWACPRTEGENESP